MAAFFLINILHTNFLLECTDECLLCDGPTLSHLILTTTLRVVLGLYSWDRLSHGGDVLWFVQCLPSIMNMELAFGVFTVGPGLFVHLGPPFMFLFMCPLYTMYHR